MKINIKRKKYLDQIRPFYGKQLIKVITGQRRVGKSFFLLQLMEELKEVLPKNNTIYIDKEKHEFDHIKNHTDLITYVNQHSSKKMNCLFIDEVQEIKNFEKALRSLLSDGNFDIYCSGSNSNMFSSEIATYLSGRQILVSVHSLSYPEFLMFHKLKKGKESLMQYLKTGGLPYLIHLTNDEEIWFDYLKNIRDTIIYRDIIARYNVRDTAFLENLVYYIADNIGNIVSANRISDYMKSQKNFKATSIIINYLKYFSEACFVNETKRAEIQGKKIFESGCKYYFEDLGIRNSITGFKPEDIGKIIENAVYNHLRYLNYKVNVGKHQDKEIDFICEKDGNIKYIQVTYLLQNKNVTEREFGNLLKIQDNYPKYVISMDDFKFTASNKGVIHLRLEDFLLSDF